MRVEYKAGNSRTATIRADLLVFVMAGKAYSIEALRRTHESLSRETRACNRSFPHRVRFATFYGSRMTECPQFPPIFIMGRMTAGLGCALRLEGNG